MAQDVGGLTLSFSGLRSRAAAHHARWVRIALLVLAAGYTVDAVSAVVLGTARFPDILTSLGALACAGIALRLVRHGHIAVAAVIGVGAVWTEAHLSILLSWWYGTAGMLVLPAVVAGTGLLLGSRAALYLAVVTSVTAPLAAVVSIRTSGFPVTGSDIQVLVVLAAILLGVAGFVQLSLRSFSEILHQAEVNERRFGELFRGAPDGIIAVDASGRVEAMNPAAVELLAHAEAEDEQPRALELLQARSEDADPRQLAALVVGSIPRLALRVGTGAGGRYLDVTARRVQRQDGSAGVELMLRDVTEHRRAEAERLELQAQLQHAQKLEALGRLAGGVAHDFNNMLMAIGAAGEMLAEELTGEQRELAQQVLRAQQRGAALTRRLLTFARRDVAQPRPMELAQAVREVEPLLRRLIGERCTLRVALPAAGRIMADPGQVEQVLLNLAANARDAMPSGGVLEIEVTDGVMPESGAPAAVLRVEDTGHGMDEATLERVFEPFYTTKPRGQGTGLGLAMVHGVVTHHGGRIAVKSVPGAGTCFTVWWPASGNGPLEAEPPSRPGSGAATGTVLVVEDDPQSREVIQTLLERTGCRVLAVATGAEALRALAGAGARTDLLLADVGLPDMSGRDLAVLVRRERPRLPVLLMTGHGESPGGNAGTTAHQHDAFPLLHKPFRGDDLRRRVAELLDAARR